MGRPPFLLRLSWLLGRGPGKRTCLAFAKPWDEVTLSCRGAGPAEAARQLRCGWKGMSEMSFEAKLPRLQFQNKNSRRPVRRGLLGTRTDEDKERGKETEAKKIFRY